MKILNILRNAFFVLTVLLVAVVGFLKLSGTECFAVQSDSMLPVFGRGDAVFVRHVAFEELEEADIISAHFPDSDGIFTHRIVTVDREQKQVTTRGDANMSDDPMPTQAEKIIGRYWFSVPYVGLLALNIQNPVILYVLVGIALILVMTRLIFSLIKKKDE